MALAKTMIWVLCKGQWEDGRVYEKSYMLASNCLQHRAPLLSKSFWAQTVKRRRPFQSSATDDAVAAQTMLALIMAFTPAILMLETLEGRPLFYNRDELQH